MFYYESLTCLKVKHKLVGKVIVGIIAREGRPGSLLV